MLLVNLDNARAFVRETPNPNTTVPPDKPVPTPVGSADKSEVGSRLASRHKLSVVNPARLVGNSTEFSTTLRINLLGLTRKPRRACSFSRSPLRSEREARKQNRVERVAGYNSLFYILPRDTKSYSDPRSPRSLFLLEVFFYDECVLFSSRFYYG